MKKISLYEFLFSKDKRKERIDEVVLENEVKVRPAVGLISLKHFEQFLLPLITNDPKLQDNNFTIFNDTRLPASNKAAFEKVYYRAQLKLNLLCIAIPWLLATIPAGLSVGAKPFFNISLLSPRTMVLGVIIGYPCYPYLFDAFSTLEIINPDTGLFQNWKHPQVIRYRQRLLLNCPYYANIKYTNNYILKNLDGLDLWKADDTEEKLYESFE